MRDERGAICNLIICNLSLTAAATKVTARRTRLSGIAVPIIRVYFSRQTKPVSSTYLFVAENAYG